MRYFLRETQEEIDLKCNAPDNGSCPRCGHYNAMLAVNDQEVMKAGGDLLACRDCKCEVIVREEGANLTEMAQEFVANASDVVIIDAISHLRYIHGSSLCTAKEFNAMLKDADYARETLHNTSYTDTLFSYFVGFVDGGANGSVGLKAVATCLHV